MPGRNEKQTMDEEKLVSTRIEQEQTGWASVARSRVWPALRAWLAPEHLKHYQARIFQGYILVSLIAFVILTIFASLAAYFEVDLEITRAIQDTIPPWLGTFLYWLSWPGYVTGAIVVVGALITILIFLGLRWESLIALLTAAAATLLNNLIKFAIRRPRPDSDLVDVFESLTSYSFPSGHVMFYTAFFGFMAFLSFTLVKRSWLRVVLVSVFSLLVLLIGLSRIYLGEHWASDVVGAYLLGFLILIATIRIYRKGQQRRMTHTGKESEPEP